MQTTTNTKNSTVIAPPGFSAGRGNRETRPGWRTAESARIRAATRLEAIAILTVVGFLVVVLLPTLAQARERGRRVICRSNLKDFYHALWLYGNDNQGILPRGARDNGDESAAFISSKMRNSLVRYQGHDRFLVCPNMSHAKAWGREGGLYSTNVGYSIGYFYLGGFTGTPWGDFQGFPGWVSPQKLTDNPELALAADLTTWSPPLKWTLAPHGIQGPVILGAPINSRVGGMQAQAVGVNGCNVLSVNGAANWKGTKKMGVYLYSGFGESYIGSW